MSFQDYLRLRMGLATGNNQTQLDSDQANSDSSAADLSPGQDNPFQLNEFSLYFNPMVNVLGSPFSAGLGLTYNRIWNQRQDMDWVAPDVAVEINPEDGTPANNLTLDNNLNRHEFDLSLVGAVRLFSFLQLSGSLGARLINFDGNPTKADSNMASAHLDKNRYDVDGTGSVLLGGVDGQASATLSLYPLEAIPATADTRLSDLSIDLTRSTSFGATDVNVITGNASGNNFPMTPEMVDRTEQTIPGLLEQNSTPWQVGLSYNHNFSDPSDKPNSVAKVIQDAIGTISRPNRTPSTSTDTTDAMMTLTTSDGKATSVKVYVNGEYKNKFNVTANSATVYPILSLALGQKYKVELKADGYETLTYTLNIPGTHDATQTYTPRVRNKHELKSVVTTGATSTPNTTPTLPIGRHKIDYSQYDPALKTLVRAMPRSSDFRQRIESADESTLQAFSDFLKAAKSFKTVNYNIAEYNIDREDQYAEIVDLINTLYPELAAPNTDVYKALARDLLTFHNAAAKTESQTELAALTPLLGATLVDINATYYSKALIDGLSENHRNTSTATQLENNLYSILATQTDSKYLIASLTNQDKEEAKSLAHELANNPVWNEKLPTFLAPRYAAVHKELLDFTNTKVDLADYPAVQIVVDVMPKNSDLRRNVIAADADTLEDFNNFLVTAQDFDQFPYDFFDKDSIGRAQNVQNEQAKRALESFCKDIDSSKANASELYAKRAETLYKAVVETKEETRLTNALHTFEYVLSTNQSLYWHEALLASLPVQFKTIALETALRNVLFGKDEPADFITTLQSEFPDQSTQAAKSLTESEVWNRLGHLTPQLYDKYNALMNALLEIAEVAPAEPATSTDTLDPAVNVIIDAMPRLSELRRRLEKADEETQEAFSDYIVRYRDLETNSLDQKAKQDLVRSLVTHIILPEEQSDPDNSNLPNKNRTISVQTFYDAVIATQSETNLGSSFTESVEHELHKTHSSSFRWSLTDFILNSLNANNPIDGVSANDTFNKTDNFIYDFFYFPFWSGKTLDFDSAKSALTRSFPGHEADILRIILAFPKWEEVDSLPSLAKEEHQKYKSLLEELLADFEGTIEPSTPSDTLDPAVQVLINVMPRNSNLRKRLKKDDEFLQAFSDHLKETRELDFESVDIDDIFAKNFSIINTQETPYTTAAQYKNYLDDEIILYQAIEDTKNETGLAFLLPVLQYSLNEFYAGYYSYTLKEAYDEKIFIIGAFINGDIERGDFPHIIEHLQNQLGDDADTIIPQMANHPIWDEELPEFLEDSFHNYQQALLEYTKELEATSTDPSATETVIGMGFIKTSDGKSIGSVQFFIGETPIDLIDINGNEDQTSFEIPDLEFNKSYTLKFIAKGYEPLIVEIHTPESPDSDATDVSPEPFIPELFVLTALPTEEPKATTDLSDYHPEVQRFFNAILDEPRYKTKILSSEAALRAFEKAFLATDNPLDYPESVDIILEQEFFEAYTKTYKISEAATPAESHELLLQAHADLEELASYATTQLAATSYNSFHYSFDNLALVYKDMSLAYGLYKTLPTKTHSDEVYDILLNYFEGGRADEVEYNQKAAAEKAAKAIQDLYPERQLDKVFTSLLGNPFWNKEEAHYHKPLNDAILALAVIDSGEAPEVQRESLTLPLVMNSSDGKIGGKYTVSINGEENQEYSFGSETRTLDLPKPEKGVFIYRIQFSAEGYKTQTLTRVILANKNTDFEQAHITLQKIEDAPAPKPTTGEMKITFKVAGESDSASIDKFTILNSKGEVTLTTGPVKNISLEDQAPGKYTLVIEDSRFDTPDIEYKIEAGKSKELEVSLLRIDASEPAEPKLSDVKLTFQDTNGSSITSDIHFKVYRASDPASALNLIINAGSALNKPDIPQGEWVIEIAADGYKTFKSTINIDSENFSHVIKLEKESQVLEQIPGLSIEEAVEEAYAMMSRDGLGVFYDSENKEIRDEFEEAIIDYYTNPTPENAEKVIAIVRASKFSPKDKAAIFFDIEKHEFSKGRFTWTLTQKVKAITPTATVGNSSTGSSDPVEPKSSGVTGTSGSTSGTPSDEEDYIDIDFGALFSADASTETGSTSVDPSKETPSLPLVTEADFYTAISRLDEKTQTFLKGEFFRLFKTQLGDPSAHHNNPKIYTKLETSTNFNSAISLLINMQNSGLSLEQTTQALSALRILVANNPKYDYMQYYFAHYEIVCLAELHAKASDANEQEKVISTAYRTFRSLANSTHFSEDTMKAMQAKFLTDKSVNKSRNANFKKAIENDFMKDGLKKYNGSTSNTTLSAPPSGLRGTNLNLSTDRNLEPENPHHAYDVDLSHIFSPHFSDLLSIYNYSTSMQKIAEDGFRGAIVITFSINVDKDGNLIAVDLEVHERDNDKKLLLKEISTESRIARIKRLLRDNDKTIPAFDAKSKYGFDDSTKSYTYVTSTETRI